MICTYRCPEPQTLKAYFHLGRTGGDVLPRPQGTTFPMLPLFNQVLFLLLNQSLMCCHTVYRRWMNSCKRSYHKGCRMPV